MNTLIERVKKYIATHTDISQEKLAKQIGISGAALSGFLRSSYKGDQKAIADKLEALLAADESRSRAVSEIRSPEIVETNIMRQIKFGMDYARDRNDIIVIYGAPGIGKTITARDWVADNPTSIFITANPNLATKRCVMEEILEALRQRTDSRADRMHRSIVKALEKTNRPIIIDEAHFLRLEALETLRAIYDATGVPLILISNPTIMDRITEKNKLITGQFFSRSVKIQLNEAVPLEDVEAIVLQNGIELDEEALEELHRAANKTGALRLMTKLYLFALKMAHQAGEKLSLRHIQAAEQVITIV